MTMSPVRDARRPGPTDPAKLPIKEARQRMLRHRLRFVAARPMALVTTVAVWLGDGRIKDRQSSPHE
jgi:hypothetical protein